MASMLVALGADIDRDGRPDAQGGELSLLDCMFYATASLSATATVTSRRSPSTREW